MTDERPSPEEMLARAAAEEARARRGRLKVFFGAAPGVGKTFAMLEAGQTHRRRGEDVVVGWLDTHGRAETAALVEGLEVLPRRAVEHRGIRIEELDLDGLLARRPRLALVDELAHTNAPGSRHVRRWQDVEELLDAGIDVFTTLNVQHVESLRDVVSQITGVTVAETVPDAVLDRADEIELVDLPPEELLQRLREGKVYLPDAARRAMEHFFTKGNLIALRELALRRTAERVDEQAAEWKRDQGVGAPWGARERVLVAVGPAPQSADLVRAAGRMAARLRAPWIALSVESSGFDRLPEEDRARATSHLRLAESLGAETMVVRGERVGDEILAAARARDVTRIVVGKPAPKGLWARLRPSLVDWLVRGSGTIDVHVTTGGTPGPAAPRPVAAAPSGGPAGWGAAWACTAVAIATGLGWLLRGYFDLADQSMLQLLAIVAVAARFRRRDALLASVLAVGALDFFFVEPFYTFAIDDSRYVMTFVMLFLVGWSVATFAERVRRQAEASRQRERDTAALYDLSRGLASAEDPAEVARLGVEQLRRLLGVAGAVWQRDADGRVQAHGLAAVPALGEGREEAVARWVLEHARPAGLGTDTLPASRGLYLPLVAGGRTVGVLGVEPPVGPASLSPARRQLLETLAAQLALALERSASTATAQRARVAAATERTRSTLLAAVSHDLRTPLAGIHGAAEALIETGADLSPDARHELLASIRDEARRLGRLVSDLLELTRLESGALTLHVEWYPLEELVAAALERARTLLEGREVSTSMPEEVLQVRVDPVLIEQVVWNLLENAARHTPPGTPVEVRAAAVGGQVVLEVLDRGPGVPPGEEDLVFERFRRAHPEDRGSGTGLGLALSRTIASVHGGTLTVRAREGGGCAFRLTLPAGEAPPPTPAEPGGEARP